MTERTDSPMYHDPDNMEDFDIRLMQLKDSWYIPVFDELIMDLSDYLEEYGSRPHIEEMEEKYDFNYEEVREKCDKLYGEFLDEYE